MRPSGGARRDHGKHLDPNLNNGLSGLARRELPPEAGTPRDHAPSIDSKFAVAGRTAAAHTSRPRARLQGSRSDSVPTPRRRRALACIRRARQQFQPWAPAAVPGDGLAGHHGHAGRRAPTTPTPSGCETMQSQSTATKPPPTYFLTGMADSATSRHVPGGQSIGSGTQQGWSTSGAVAAAPVSSLAPRVSIAAALRWRCTDVHYNAHCCCGFERARALAAVRRRWRVGHVTRILVSHGSGFCRRHKLARAPDRDHVAALTGPLCPAAGSPRARTQGAEWGPWPRDAMIAADLRFTLPHHGAHWRWRRLEWRRCAPTFTPAVLRGPF